MFSLEKIKIKNFKSIKDTEFAVSGHGLYIFTGKNGVGKSNVLNALDMFYDYAHRENFIPREGILSLNLNLDVDKIKKHCLVKEFDASDFIRSGVLEDINKNSIDSLKVVIGKDCKLLDSQNNTIESPYINTFIKDNFSNGAKYLNAYEMMDSVSYSKENLFFESYDFEDLDELKSTYLYFLICYMYDSVIKKFDECKLLKEDYLDGYLNSSKFRYSVIDSIVIFANDFFNEYNVFDFDKIIYNKKKEKFQYILQSQKLNFSSLSSGQISKIKFLSKYFLADYVVSNFKGEIIIIDEPENSQHPSAIKEMRKIILDMSKNNYVFIATHSPFMIDYKQDAGHNVHYYEVTNNEDEGTKVRKLEEDESFHDNKLFESAFGLSFMSELLSSKILVVEGETDVKIFRKYFENKGIQILGGDGKKVNQWIEFLREKVNANSKIIALFDADGDGQRYYDYNKSKAECYLLTDIDSSLVNGAQLEDLYDISYIKSEIADMNSSYSYDEKLSVWCNVKSAGLNSKKKELKDKWNEYFIINNSDKIRSFAKRLEEKFNS